MYLAGHSIPISIDVTASDVAQGTIIIEGLLSYEDGQLFLETQSTSNRLEKSDVRVNVLPLYMLQEIRLKKRLTGSRIVLRTKSIDALAGIPGTSGNGLMLKVKREQRENAADLVTLVQIELSERMLEEM